MALQIEELINLYHQYISDEFSKLPGEKYLCVEPELLRPLDRVADMTFMKTLNIIKVVHFTSKPLPENMKKVIYLIRPTLDSTKEMAGVLRADKESKINRHVLVAFVPTMPATCRYILESEGTVGYNVRTTSLELNWIPLDSDFLTLSLPQVFTSFFLEDDTSWMHWMGKAIGQIITHALDTPAYACNVHAFGRAAEVAHFAISDYLAGRDVNLKSKGHGSTSIFLFSRDIDYVTPLCIPISFEALLHEIIGIDLGVVTFTPDITGESDPIKLFLNSKTEVYKEIRDMHISRVSEALRNRKASIDDTASKMKYAQNISDYKNFIDQDLNYVLEQRRVLNCVFSGLTEIVKRMTEVERVEDILSAQNRLLAASEDIQFTKDLIVEWLTTSTSIGQSYHVSEALRLLCLMTVTSDGLANTLYEEMFQLVCHSAGHAALPLLHALRKLRLFAPRSDWLSQSTTYERRSVASESVRATERLIKEGFRKSSYMQIKRHLNLSSVTQTERPLTPVNPSFVFGGYHTPISCRLLEETLTRRASDLEETIRHLNLPPGASGQKVSLSSGTSVRGDHSKQAGGANETVIVCFLGGCSLPEIAAVRQLADNHRWRSCLILTSDILSSQSLIGLAGSCGE